MSQKTILVVDDELDLRESLGDALMDEGYAVFMATNGKEALALLPKLSRPCAVILDLIMPVMGGDEVYRMMRAAPELADIPILVSTSDPSRAPANALVMRKPISLDRLLTTVAALF